MKDSRTQMGRGLLAFGSGTAAVGLVVLVLALFTESLSSVGIGVALLVTGAIQLVQAPAYRQVGDFGLHTMGGLAYALAGIVFLSGAGTPALPFAFTVGLLLLISGASRAINAGFNQLPNWGWLVASGVVSAFLGITMIGDLTKTARWVMGLLVGAELILNGLSLATLGVRRRRGTPAAIREGRQQAA